MGNDKKKNQIDKKPAMVQEPAIEYKSNSDILSEGDMPELLKKLLEKGIAQCEKGETTSHEVVMERIKKKYNLPL
jgi:hypothetical protein